MREDIQKNFILLSKVDKEKKYAQEYLGLLARRGDIGSIRIGKRWYTTREWFEEFLENSQKKKSEAFCEVAEKKTEEIEVKKNIPKAGLEQNIKINLPIAPPAREKVYVAHPAAVPVRISAVATAVKREAGRTGAIGDIRMAKKNIVPKLLPPKKISVEERNRHAVPYPEIRIRKSEGVFSPDFSKRADSRTAFFPRFAFAAGLAIMICLAAISGYFIYTGGLFERGMVAGASDEKSGGLSGIKAGGDYLLTGAGEKIKESLSISRVVMEVAREKEKKAE